MNSFEAWAFDIDLSFSILHEWIVPFLPDDMIEVDVDAPDMGLYIVCLAA